MTHRRRTRRDPRLLTAIGAALAVIATAALVPVLQGAGTSTEVTALTGPAATAAPAADGSTGAVPKGTTAPDLTGLVPAAKAAKTGKAAAARRPRPRPTATTPRPTTSAPAVPTATSARKGASIWKSAGMAAALRDVGASWFYTWGPDDKGVSVPGVEFVPMIWGAGNATDATLATAKAHSGGSLLGFNEPDLAGQAQMTVEQALALWPKLQTTGLRLGAPAVAYGGNTPGGWLDRFMTGAAARGYRVDFIPLHWYGGDFSSAATGQLQAYVSAVHARYHKPIWITEYALLRFGPTTYPSAAQESAFIASSTAMLRGLSYVERYAWFSLATPDEGGDGTGLYRPDGSRTAGGTAYRAAT